MSNEQEPIEETSEKLATNFDEDLIKKYPRSNRKLPLEVSAYGISLDGNDEKNSLTTFISPHGIEFRSNKEYPEGTLLKINVAIPDYWSRKRRFVEYGRIDNPEQFRILAKVVRTEDVGKRGRKKMVIAQTVVIDDIDEQVLKSYLQDG